jgi:hypothetical protein
MFKNEKPNFISPEDQDMIYKKIREEKKASLDKLINENPYNKEPFDYQQFVELYWRQDIQGKDLNGSEGQEIIDEYTRLYYGSLPEAKTMEDFAKAKEKLDAEIN